jgi:hypothetical protein
MLISNKEKILSWKDLEQDWDSYDSPPVPHDLIELWADLSEELEARFPDCVIWIVPFGGGGIGMDFHKLMLDKKWSDDITVCSMIDMEKMDLGDVENLPFDKEAIFKHLEEFRANVVK